MPSYAVSIPVMYRKLILVDADTEREAVSLAKHGEGMSMGKGAEKVLDTHECIAAEVA